MVAASLLGLQVAAFAQNRGTTDVTIINNQPIQRLSEKNITESQPYINPLKGASTNNLAPATAIDKPLNATPGAITEKSPGLIGIQAYGSFGVPFTSKRVSHQPTFNVSSNSNAYLSATFPYSATGRLTFNVGQSTAHCSASLIRKSVIVTAAHCVQNFGSGANIFSNFSYTPAFYNGSAPYGSWSWEALVRPNTWANGTDTGSGATRNNDLAVLIIAKNSQGQFIGDITGYLGYGWNNYSFVSSKYTGNLTVAALTTLGYPGLLDSGRIMQRSDGPSYLTTLSGAKQIYQGSNFTKGSSGGPWIANFGYENPVFSSGANAGNQSLSGVVVGVTSWGESDPNGSKNNYSSQFAQNKEYPNASYGNYGAGNIGSLLNQLCSTKRSGSNMTYAQLGYCS
ncbi:hypothetical protein IJ00_03010 [Calothrix sp. 336/3]|nr:hypothetical protein IJ00_03010 [Calothrix sp. 336/3]